MYIFEQIFHTVKGYEYLIAVGFLFLFIFFYKFLSTDKTDEEE